MHHANHALVISRYFLVNLLFTRLEMQRSRSKSTVYKQNPPVRSCRPSRSSTSILQVEHLNVAPDQCALAVARAIPDEQFPQRSEEEGIAE